MSSPARAPRASRHPSANASDRPTGSRRVRPELRAAARAAVERLEDRLVYSAFPLQAWAPQVDQPDHFAPDGLNASGTSAFTAAAGVGNGLLDPAFGVGGKTINPFTATDGIAMLPDGRFILGGDAYNAGDGWRQFALARFNADGSRDTTFAPTTAGTALADFGRTTESVYDVVVQSDGKIIAIGVAVETPPVYSPIAQGGMKSWIAIARFNADGSPDTSFGGGDGTLLHAVGTINAGFDALLQPDGSLLVGGATGTLGATDDDNVYTVAVTRFLSGGTPDASFGAGGTSVLNWGTKSFISSLGLDAAGRIVFTGSPHGEFGTLSNVMVGRLTASGALDTSFGTGGRTNGPWMNASGTVAVRPDGRLVVSFSSQDEYLSVLGLTADGRPDPTFGVNGVATAGGQVGMRIGGAAQLGVEPDGKVVAGGMLWNPALNRYDFGVTRFTAAGALDHRFGLGGFVYVTYSPVYYDRITAMALAGDGRILVTGPINADRGTGLALVDGREIAAATGSIAGALWDDFDADGVRDAGEGALAGRTVYLDANRNGRRDASETSTLTASDGTYQFLDLQPGQHFVAQEVPAGWRPTRPAPTPGRIAGAAGVAGSLRDSVGSTPLVPITTTASVMPAYSTGTVATSAPAWNDAQAGAMIGLDRLASDPRFASVRGGGFSVAVLDTGIDLDHPAFGHDANADGVADRIRHHQDFYYNDADGSDFNGHGTHVAGIIAGAAPEADIVALKVLGDGGNGDFAAIERALQWVVVNAATYGIAAVNLSISDGGNYASHANPMFYGLSDELAALAAMNVIVVSSAGNDFGWAGSAPGVAYPAADPSSLAIGAVYDANVGARAWAGSATDYTTGSDRIASFSQRSPYLTTVFAPGATITGAGVGTGGAVRDYSGTSQAAPHVAAVTVLAQQIAERQLGRRLTLADLRDLLRDTGATIVDGDDENDSVLNTAAAYKRLDAFGLAEAVAALGSGASAPVAVSLSEGDQKAGVHFSSHEIAPPPPIADIVDVSPDPRTAGVAEAIIRFDQPVFGFDLGDLSLVRNGATTNLLTTAQTLVTTDGGVTWTVGGLLGVTSFTGDYTLTLRGTGSGIANARNTALAIGAADAFRIDMPAPTADVIDVTPDPRPNGVGQIVVRFSEAVTGLDVADFTLSRDDGPNLLGAGQTVTTDDDGVTWTIGGLAAATATSGRYLLTLRAAGSGVVGALGTPLPADASDSWVRVDPPAWQQSTANNGLVSVEAEAFDANTPAGGWSWAPVAGTAYSGKSAVQAGPNSGAKVETGVATVSPRLDYLVNFVKTGVHYVWVRGFGHTTADDSVHAGLDGVVQSSSDNLKGFRSAGSWSKATDDGPVATINVTTPGLHTLNLWMREDGFVADRIVLTTSSSYTPSGSGPAASPRTGGGTVPTPTPTPSPTPTAVTLAPAADAHVQDGAASSANFGSAADLVVKKSSSTGSNREAYLRFDLSSLTTVSSAKLRLFGRISDTRASSLGVALFAAGNTAWDESGLTWSTKPATAGSSLGSRTVTGPNGQWCEWDLTAFVAAQKSAGKTSVTLVIRGTVSSSPTILFGSGEAAANGPQLVVAG